jgi:hypothetical protein
MKFTIAFFLGLLVAFSAAKAQVELVSGNYFPAELEFQELQSISSETGFQDKAELSKIQDGRLVSDVGFDKYATRVYSAGDSGSLSIEILTLQDSRAAYSLLTLLGHTGIQEGLPGDFFTKLPDGLLFSHGRHWARIQGKRISEDLVRRVAISVSNRLGPKQSKPPSLVSHLPKTGFDASTLRYYPGTKAYKDYSGVFGGPRLRLSSDMEIAHARYSTNSVTGTLTLLSFPTAEIAEDYFAILSAPGTSDRTGNKTYLKRAGPIVGILDGSYDPGSAKKLLDSIQFSYSIRWVYEKNQPKTVWGIPGGILRTVVRSFFLVAVLGVLSIIAGICIALFRVILRRRSNPSPEEQDNNEMTRLKMR